MCCPTKERDEGIQEKRAEGTNKTWKAAVEAGGKVTYSGLNSNHFTNDAILDGDVAVVLAHLSWLLDHVLGRVFAAGEVEGAAMDGDNEVLDIF